VVRRDYATSSDVLKLLQQHLNGMQAQTPAESVHALDLGAYQQPGLYLWTAWAEEHLMGCGALKDHGQQDGVHLGEIKSMRTKDEFVRMGVANTVLSTILNFAADIGMQRVSLETGRTAHFKAALAFYQRHGFTETAPFCDYTDDPHSVYYSIEINRK